MKQLHQQIPRKRKNLACRCLLVAKKEFSYWIWNKIITNNARNIVNWNVNKLELSDFYPTDLVNTITTIPLRICWSADHWAYRSQSPYSAWQRQWRGFRPIGVGEVIRRIIGKCVTRVAKQDVINASGAMYKVHTVLQMAVQITLHIPRFTPRRETLQKGYVIWSGDIRWLTTHTL